MKRILIVILLSAGLLFCARPSLAQTPQRGESTLEALFVDAVQLYEDEAYSAAKDRFSIITEADPDNDAAYYYMGLCDYYLENVKDAEAAFKEAVRLDPSNYWYRDRLAVLYSLSGKDALAISIYESLLEDYPKKTDILYNLVNLYAQSGQMDKVLGTLDSIEAITGKDETTTLARYDVLMRQDKADEAFKALEAFNEDYSSPQILSMMGDACVTADRDSLALSYYEEALSLDSEYAPAMIGRSEVFRLDRRYDEYFAAMHPFTLSGSVPSQMKSQYLSSLTDHLDARFAQNYRPQLDSLFEEAVLVHPSDSSILLAAGSYFFRSDRRDRAGELFKSNMTQHPDSFSAAATYVQSLSYGEDWEALAEASEEAFALFPDEPGFLDMKVLAHYNLSRYEDVLRDCRRELELFPRDSSVVLQAYSTIGDVYHLIGDTKQAFKAYDRALKLNPTYAPVLNNYAYYLSLTGKKLKKAYSMSAVTVEQEPDNPTYLDTFAWILHLQGKDLEAKSFFKHAMLYGGKESATILEHYAEVLSVLGDDSLAKVYRDMAAKLPAE